jgi:hypothetical protein
LLSNFFSAFGIESGFSGYISKLKSSNPQTSLRASLTEPEKTQTKNAEFSAPKTRVLSKFAVAQNKNRIMELKRGIRNGAGKI